MSDTFDVSDGAAYAILYTVLAGFTVLAVFAAGYCGSGGILSKLGCIMKAKASDESDGTDGTGGNLDFFLAARNSAGAR